MLKDRLEEGGQSMGRAPSLAPASILIESLSCSSSLRQLEF